MRLRARLVRRLRVLHKDENPERYQLLISLCKDSSIPWDVVLNSTRAQRDSLCKGASLYHAGQRAALDELKAKRG